MEFSNVLETCRSVRLSGRHLVDRQRLKKRYSIRTRVVVVYASAPQPGHCLTVCLLCDLDLSRDLHTYLLTCDVTCPTHFKPQPELLCFWGPSIFQEQDIKTNAAKTNKHRASSYASSCINIKASPQTSLT